MGNRIYVVFWFGSGSAEPPNLTEPVSLAEPEPKPERFGLPLVELIRANIANRSWNRRESCHEKRVKHVKVSSS